MKSKNFVLKISFQIILLSLTALALSLFLLKENYGVSALFLIALIVQSAYLIYFLNSTNRKIANFFQSIKNEDFTIHFDTDTSNESINTLNKSLNMLNRMIQEVHLKNQAQEKFYREIIKQAEIGILTYNKKGHILFANPKIEELFNYSPLNHIKQIEKIDIELYRLFNESKPFDRKMIHLTNEREIKQIALKFTSVILEQEALLLVVAQDIYKELDEKETDSWVRLIRVLTHEIMNTITPVVSISESVLKYYKNKDVSLSVSSLSPVQIDNTIEGLEIIKEQGNYLMNFVESYRSLLNIPPPDRSIVSAHQLLSKVQLLMKKQFENKNITLQISVEPEDLSFFIDEKQISQILINLTKNALQSTNNRPNGIVKLTASAKADNKKYIEVWDNGPGIPPNLIDQIFVPFFTTKTQGTGIGLSLSKHIMHMHGGNLKVYSVADKETTFTLWF